MYYKISVIVPVYNVENYLHKCLDSLLNQTLTDIEIIIVNDGSTDNSQSIIDKYSDKYKNIKPIVKENSGLSEARNVGIKHATGEYLAFIDSDDWVHKNMMKEMYDLGKKYAAEIVLCNLQNVNEKGQIIKRLPQLPQLPEKIELITDFTIFGEMSCFACNKIFKKELFNGIEFPKGLHFEDIATIPRLFTKANVIAKSDKYFYQYLVRTGSITRNYTSKGLDMFTAINLVKDDFFKSSYKNNVKDWKKFVILQGFYSFLAYYAYVKNDELKRQMLKSLRGLIRQEKISKREILHLERFRRNYLFSLNFKKIIYYLIQLTIL